MLVRWIWYSVICAKFVDRKNTTAHYFL